LSTSFPIGLFCGTFNPIHNAHLLLAQCACEQFQLKKVYFVTSPRPPHRRDISLPGETRHAMVSKAVSENNSFIASAIELERPGPSYTIHTIKYFEEHIKDDLSHRPEINLLLGADNILHLPTWLQYAEIAQHVRLLIAPRRISCPVNAEIKTNKPELLNMFSKDELAILSTFNYAVIDFPLIDISSSHIRRCIKEGKSARYMVPESVWQLIIKEKIYQ
jgi:nicotinate-nucleotide adenylyltransferase